MKPISEFASDVFEDIEKDAAIYCEGVKYGLLAVLKLIRNEQRANLGVSNTLLWNALAQLECAVSDLAGLPRPTYEEWKAKR